jgi:hypothetical protein
VSAGTVLLAVAASPDVIAPAQAALAAHIAAPGGAPAGAWLYAPGRTEVPAPVRFSNLEGLGDAWLDLRNIALCGGAPEAVRACFAEGCVALALADLAPKLAEAGDAVDAVLVIRPGERPVRLGVAQFGEASLARLAAAYISGDVWSLAGTHWPMVLSAVGASVNDAP